MEKLTARSPKELGEVIKLTRKRLKLTQKDLALTSGTGLRFILELEKGKATSQLGKTLTVLGVLGISVILARREESSSGPQEPLGPGDGT